MNLRKYYEQLGSFISDHPEALEYKVIYAKDDEGNGYNSVNYKPSLGLWDLERDGDFTIVEYFEENEIEGSPNAVCIN